jgi:predicted PurR-regulated permease PerM
VVAWWLLSLLAPVLMPFVVAAVMAYALHPVVEAAPAVCPRWLGAGVAMRLLMLVLLAVVLLIVPVVTKQVPLLREQVPALLEQLNAWLMPLAARLGVDLQIDVPMVRDLLRRLVSGHEGRVDRGPAVLAAHWRQCLAAVLGNLVLMPIVAYYLLLDWSGLVERTKRLVPPRWQACTQRFLDETDEVLGQYLRGQLLVMGVLAVFYTVGLALVGLKLALPIGVFTGLAVFVPYLGLACGAGAGAAGRLAAVPDAAGAWPWWAGVHGGAGVREHVPHAAPAGRAHRPAPDRGDLCPHGLWPPVRLCRGADCLPASAVLLVAIRACRCFTCTAAVPGAATCTWRPEPRTAATACANRP